MLFCPIPVLIIFWTVFPLTCLSILANHPLKIYLHLLDEGVHEPCQLLPALAVLQALGAVQSDSGHGSAQHGVGAGLLRSCQNFAVKGSCFCLGTFLKQ